MLVTFKTQYYSNITMFGNVALTFVKIMGHSGTVPGAIRAEDVPEALQRLSKAVEQVPASPQSPPSSTYDDDNEDNEPVVSLRQRALPLIELLQSAVESESNVMWE
ncbi:conserved hypothetical protein [Shewanella sediminis HAW-EB3]|uniref:DUF1840 domain-containing protein n=1 Tax=Shewanella sediminis (strain HAW-EB3) TaxID=425104 RepID=A8FZG3_SHESH|nr:DUF1840 domain-containing protein [Shewanella sediminis]ABV38236.1 conserved hypothetical protein [Shewanella sediminis HAW-EB3]